MPDTKTTETVETTESTTSAQTAPKAQTKSIKTSAAGETSSSASLNVKKTKKAKKKAAPKKSVSKANSKARSQKTAQSTSNKKPANGLTLITPLTMETIMTNKQQQYSTEKMQEAYAQMEQLANETKATGEALVKASTVWVKGMEELSRGWFAYSQKAFEQSTEASKELLSAKTVNEAIEKQSKYAQKSMNDLVSETTKMSEQAVKVSTEAFTPLKKRFEETAEKVSKAMAA